MRKIMENILSPTEYDSRLILLYFLNLFDYFFTLILISSGLFVEANPFLKWQINNQNGFILKCVLPFLLLMYLHLRFLSSPPKSSLLARLLLDIILGCYIIINAFHIFWLSYSIALFL